jgi:hypothetical protein
VAGRSKELAYVVHRFFQFSQMVLVVLVMGGGGASGPESIIRTAPVSIPKSVPAQLPSTIIFQ